MLLSKLKVDKDGRDEEGRGVVGWGEAGWMVGEGGYCWLLSMADIYLVCSSII